jgi:hypothetical protein
MAGYSSHSSLHLPHELAVPSSAMLVIRSHGANLNGVSSQVREIDVTRAATPWGWVRIGNYAMVFPCACMIAIEISVLAENQPSWSMFIGATFLGSIFALNLYVGWADVGAIDPGIIESGAHFLQLKSA